MKAFGREVTSRTIAGILAGSVLAALGAAYQLAPVVSARFGITFREVFAWLIATIALIALAFALWLLSRKPAPPSPAKPASLALTLNNGVKPTVTLTNHGGATKYRADGRIISHVDGTQSSQPTQFRCQLQRRSSKAAGTSCCRMASGRTSSSAALRMSCLPVSRA